MSDPKYAEIDHIYHVQQLHKSILKKSTSQQRVEWLIHLQLEIQEASLDIQQALYKDFGKSPIESDITEIFAVQQELKLVIKNLKSWMKTKFVHSPLLFKTIKGKLVYEPKGSTLIITPWNYPFQLPMMHLIASVAAGNTVILKPSEFTPHTNQILKKIISSVFKPAQVYIAEGAIEDTTYLLNLKFDHIHFTGSSSVGKKVMKSASVYLSDITLELGGKSPAFVHKDVEIRKVVKNLIWSKFVNAGQTCIAPDYLLIDRAIAAEFEQAIQTELIHAFGIDAQKSSDYARIINDKHFKKLQEALDEARQNEAVIIAGGHSDQSDRYFEPTVLTAVSLSAKLMQEEIFGPIFPVIYYNDVQEALDLVAAKEKPLALYIFSRDKTYTERIIQNTSAGGTCINDALVHILHPNLPFGGVNNSRIGQSFGWYGFKDFSHERSVADVRIMPLTKFFWYPYSAKTTQILSWMRKFL